MQYGSPGAPRCAQQVCWLPVESIIPRRSCMPGQTSADTLEELAESIRRSGLNRPITVEKAENGRYLVLSGNRRLMACRMLGMTYIDAVVLWGGMAEMNAHQLLQGILSGRMHYLEQARALQQLNTVCGVSREELARLTGSAPAAVTEKIRLCSLDDVLQVFLMEEGVPQRMAAALLRLSDREARMRIARQAVRHQLSIREVEALITSALSRPSTPPASGGRTICRMRDHRIYLNAIRAVIAQMQEAGVEATLTERRLADRVEVQVVMSTRRRRSR